MTWQFWEHDYSPCCNADIEVFSDDVQYGDIAQCYICRKTGILTEDPDIENGFIKWSEDDD